MGNGRFDNNSGLNGNGITAGGINFAKQQSWYDKKVEEDIASLGIPPGPPDKKGIYGSPEYTGQPYPDFGSPLNESNEPPLGWPKVPVFNQPGDVPGPPIKWGDPVTNDNVEAGWGYEGTGVIEETDLYFYHPDHLGSTSYVTTRLGKVSQHVEYIPFGEVFLEEKNDIWNSPYKFNAKEFDEETGLYYYGARYYDPKISQWYSVDPLAEMHPHISSYAYCANNPIKYIDPDGRDWVEGVSGDITWRDNVTKDNYQTEGVLKEGEIYRGTEYKRYKDWRGVKDGEGNIVNSVVKEHYMTNKKMEYTPLKGNMEESLGFMKQLVDKNIRYSQVGIRNEFSDRGMSALDCSETVALFLYAYGSMSEMTSIYTGAMTTESGFRKAIGSNDITGMGSIVPSPGDIFVWRYDGAGHTGIVYSYDKQNDLVTILEAIGKSGSADSYTNRINGGTILTGVTRTAVYKRTGGALQGHAGWKGYFRPK